LEASVEGIFMALLAPRNLPRGALPLLKFLGRRKPEAFAAVAVIYGFSIAAY
jgi:hypothetical protein